jgi:hypothetical protein
VQVEESESFLTLWESHSAVDLTYSPTFQVSAFACKQLLNPMSWESSAAQLPGNSVGVTPMLLCESSPCATVANAIPATLHLLHTSTATCWHGLVSNEPSSPHLSGRRERLRHRRVGWQHGHTFASLKLRPILYLICRVWMRRRSGCIDILFPTIL